MSTRFKDFAKWLCSIAEGVTSLIFPAHCAICGNLLNEYERSICIDCALMMPRTQFHKLPNNPMAERMRSLSPTTKSAAALFYFHDKSVWREFIHRVKYRKAWRDALTMGYLYGVELREEEAFSSIDVVVPVPLHPMRRLKRGYNQSEYIAQGLASALGVKLSRHALKRLRNNTSQTKHTSEERWENVKSLFKLRKGSVEDGAHILLVDDVFTTGATISSCSEAIRESLPNATISVVTLSLSARHFRLKA